MTNIYQYTIGITDEWNLTRIAQMINERSSREIFNQLRDSKDNIIRLTLLCNCFCFLFTNYSVVIDFADDHIGFFDY